MRRHRIYSCEECTRSIYRSNRTDRRKLCPDCAAEAVARNARELHARAHPEPRGVEVTPLPLQPEPTYPLEAA